MVIGIAADARDLGIDRDPEPEMYYSGFNNSSSLLIQTAIDPHAIVSGVREAIRSLDPHQPIGQIRTMQEIVNASLANRRLLVSFMSLFSFLALALSTIGVYGVASYSVAIRTKEIGVRIALGAGRRNILALVFKLGTAPVLVGLVLGLASSWCLRRLLSTAVYQVSPTDAATYATAGILMIVAGLIATAVPSRRAIRSDPVQALREE
ncbi:MAG TPA: FtsX-like permease family protein [Blastocatellia bacterium]